MNFPNRRIASFERDASRRVSNEEAGGALLICGDWKAYHIGKRTDDLCDALALGSLGLLKLHELDAGFRDR